MTDAAHEVEIEEPTLADLFGKEPKDEEPAPKPAPEPTDPAPEDPKAKDAEPESKAKEEVEPHDEDDLPADENATVPIRVLTATRKKYQGRLSEAERKAAMLEGQLLAMQRMQQPQTKVEPQAEEITEDAYYQDPLGTIKKIAAQTRATGGDQNASLRQSAAIMRVISPDYDKVIGSAREYLAGLPEHEARRVTNDILSSDMPAASLYQLAKSVKEAKDLGVTNIADLKTKLKEQALEEARAELRAERQKSQVAELTPSNADVPGGTGGSGEPADLDFSDLWKKKSYAGGRR